MIQRIQLTAESDVLAAPHEGSERLYRLSADSELMLLRDDDREYYKVAYRGLPLYVSKASAVRLEDTDAAPPEAFATRDATTARQQTRPVFKRPRGTAEWLRVVAGAVFLTTIALVVLTLSGETDPPGYEQLIAALVFTVGGFLASVLLGMSVLFGQPAFTAAGGETRAAGWMYLVRPIQWVLLLLGASMLATAFLLSSFAAASAASAAAAALFWAGLLAAIGFVGSLLLLRVSHTTTGSRETKR